MTDKTANALSVAGAGVLLTCACATSTTVAKLSALGGIHASSLAFHPLFHGTGAAMMLAGFFHRSRKAFGIGLIGALVLALANVGVPPSMMMSKHPSYDAAQMATLWLYVIAGALLVWSAWRAYPAHRSGSALLAMSGAVVAAGCTCCMIMGAMSGLSAMLLPSQAFLGSRTFYTLAGTLMLALGLGRLGGAMPALLAVAGEAIAYWGPDMVKRVPLTLLGVDANAFLRYPVWLLGTLVALYGFVLAYRAAQPLPQPEKARRPALATS